jgi:Ala-tRNA(Pro) deacylase
MGMSITLCDYLESLGICYDLVHHDRTDCSVETAKVAHIPADNLAKSVVVEDDRECLVCVIPASRYVAFSALDKLLDGNYYLATEEELADLFGDCERGAVPAAAQAFGIKVLVDERLLDCEDIYFEAGDHSELVHLKGDEFESLMTLAGHGRFSRHV